MSQTIALMLGAPGVLAQAPAAGGGFGSTLILIVLMVGIFYLMLWRPQQKQAKAHRAMLAALKKGDAVVTQGGFIGRVHAVSDKFLVIELGRDLRVRVLTGSISARAPEGILEEPETRLEKTDSDKEKK